MADILIDWAARTVQIADSESGEITATYVLTAEESEKASPMSRINLGEWVPRTDAASPTGTTRR